MPETESSISNLPQNPQKTEIKKDENEVDPPVIIITNQAEASIAKEEPEEEDHFVITFKTEDGVDSNENSRIYEENSEIYDESENYDNGSGNSNQNHVKEEDNSSEMKFHLKEENSSVSNFPIPHQDSDIKIENVEGTSPLKLALFGLNASSLKSKISSLLSKNVSSLKSGIASKNSSKNSSNSFSKNASSSSISSSKVASSLKSRNASSFESENASTSSKIESNSSSKIASNSPSKIASNFKSRNASNSSKIASKSSSKIASNSKSRIASSFESEIASTSSETQNQRITRGSKRKNDLEIKQETHNQSSIKVENLSDPLKVEPEESLLVEIENTSEIISYIPKIKRKKREVALLCDHCGKIFKSKYSILWHMKEHMVTMPFNCDKCGKGFTYMRSLKQHTLTHGEKVKCEICSKILTQHAIYYHMKVSHSNEKKFKCPKCPKYFKTRDSITRHMIRHKMEFPCTICDRKFAQNSRLQQHINMHNNPDDFYCKICNKHFELIERHTSRVHSKNRERNYKCKHCAYATDIKQSIERHEEMHKKRKINPEDLIKCEICDIMLQTKQGFKSHMRHYHSKMKIEKNAENIQTKDDEKKKQEKHEENDDDEEIDRNEITIKEEVIVENY